MIKFKQSEQAITAFGGINFCHELLGEAGIPSLIKRHLGSRGQLTDYDYADVLSSHLSIFLCGGDSTEDINEHLSEDLKQVPRLKVPSADTILGDIKQLATPTEKRTSSRGVDHYLTLTGHSTS